MASVLESIIQPDETAIAAHLEMLFAPLREDYPRGLIELAYGSEKPNKASYFNIHKDGIADATAFAAGRSRAGDNVYVGPNPRKHNVDLRCRASDTDVEIAAWQFADIDKAESLEGLGAKLRAMPVFYSINTGTTPHRRPHLYWLLEEPITNLAAWTERQRGIAAALGGDAVINPSRIMRLAGTVNFPPQHKLQRGYGVEVVTIKTAFDDEREAVTPEQVAAAFPPPVSAAPLYDSAPAQPLQAGQNTLQAMRSTSVQDLLDACLSGTEWHNNMIRLVAHLAGKERTNAEIMALAAHITLPGYTVAQTQREMHTALIGARNKYDMPEPAVEAIEAEEAKREPADSTFELFDINQLEAMPPPTWLIHEMIAEEGLTVLYGDPGAGKSFIALDMALRVSHGMDWHGAAAKATGVLYIAGEGRAGLGKRIQGWRKHHKMEGIEAPFLVLPEAVPLLDDKQRGKLLRTIDAAIERAGFAVGLIVVDTVSRALAGSDENGQEAMGAFVAACDQIRNHAGGALIGVHHSGKEKDRGMRGSTVLLGACDASIRLEKDDTFVTLTTEKQKDAEQAEPIKFTMHKYEWVKGLEPEQSTLVPIKAEGAVALAGGDSLTLTSGQIVRAFGIMADAWGNGRPLSHRPETRKDGRYAPAIFRSQIGGEADLWSGYIQSWLESECLAFEVCDKRNKTRGLQVLSVPGITE